MKYNFSKAYILILGKCLGTVYRFITINLILMPKQHRSRIQQLIFDDINFLTILSTTLFFIVPQAGRQLEVPCLKRYLLPYAEDHAQSLESLVLLQLVLERLEAHRILRGCMDCAVTSILKKVKPAIINCKLQTCFILNWTSISNWARTAYHTLVPGICST